MPRRDQGLRERVDRKTTGKQMGWLPPAHGGSAWVPREPKEAGRLFCPPVQSPLLGKMGVLCYP